MSVNIYARATKLTDVCGRVDYASSENRQEHLLATASTVELQYWTKLAKDCQAAFLASGGARTRMVKGKPVKDKCCEGREIVIDLPNKAQTEEDLQKLAEEIVADFKRRTGAECMVGIHLNHKENNLHIHLIYSERDLLLEPEIRIADRNAFIDEEGRRRRTKKEILDENGQLRPGCKIVPKGEVISERYFGDKNPMFKDMGWLYSFKQEMADWINERLDPDEKREVFDKFGPYLAQKHIGKGTPEEKEAQIREWNRTVKFFNGLVKDGVIDQKYAAEKKTQVALAPDQTLELKAVLAEIYCKKLPLTPDQKQRYENWMAQAGTVPRENTGGDEDLKRKLREAHRKANLAWKTYRNANPGSLESKMLMVEARKMSGEIERLRRQLGYDRPITTRERQRAIWAVHADNKAAVIESGDLQRQKQAAYEARAAKWDAYKKQKAVFDQLDPGWHRRADGRWTRGKLLEVPEGYNEAKYNMQMAREEYNQARKNVQLFNRARELETAYRRFALDLASDPDVSDADVARAKEKYQAAARRLRNPTQSTCNELQHQLSDLKKSQRTRDAKAAEAKKTEKEKAGEPER